MGVNSQKMRRAQRSRCHGDRSSHCHFQSGAERGIGVTVSSSKFPIQLAEYCNWHIPRVKNITSLFLLLAEYLKFRCHVPHLLCFTARTGHDLVFFPGEAPFE
jgi:hypothetical protein